jgi:Xaa-Pro aminopeptidase
MSITRINKFRPLMATYRIDGILLNNVSNVRYLSGFTGDSSLLIITNDKVGLITDQRYFEQAHNECPEEIEIHLWKNDIRYGNETYQYFIDNWGIQCLGIEESHMSYGTYLYLYNNLKRVALVGTTELVEKLRLIKDDVEIASLKKACQISDKAFENTIKEIKPGQTELEISALLEYNMRKEGAENISFETILLAGKRSSLLHGKPSINRLKAGDSLLFDFAALIDGYHADISRTLFLGECNEQQKEIYHIIKNCQEQILNNLKEGINVNIPNQIIKSNIPQKYITYFYPGYGHGVGLDIHEKPFLKEFAHFEFMSNMVITIEPGIYIPDWGGIRIEDTILISRNGAEALSKTSKEMIVI